MVFIKIAGWCNGNTPLFGRGIPGSSPGPAAKFDKAKFDKWKKLPRRRAYK